MRQNAGFFFLKKGKNPFSPQIGPTNISTKSLPINTKLIYNTLEHETYKRKKLILLQLLLSCLSEKTSTPPTHEIDCHQPLAVIAQVKLPQEFLACSSSPSTMLCVPCTTSQSVIVPISSAWQVGCSLQELSIVPTMCKVELTNVTFST